MKIINDNNKPTEEAKNKKKYTHFDDYLSTHTFKKNPMSLEGISRLAILLKEWADREDTLVMDDFYDEIGIVPETFWRWKQRSEGLREAHEYAKRRLGSKREKGVMTKKFDPTMIKHTHNYYSKVWRDSDEYHAELRSKYQNEKKEAITVVIENVPSSELKYKDK